MSLNKILIRVFFLWSAVWGQIPGQGFQESSVASGLAIPGNLQNVNMDRGACAGDFDGDGDQDLVVSGFPNQPVFYYRNDGNFSFTDQTAGAGLGSVVKGRAVIAADIDNDGDLDIYLGQTWAPNLLFVNDGSGHFVERAALAGVNHDGNAFAATFGDYDRDGWIDIYVGNHTTFVGSLAIDNVLFRNNQDGTFTDVTAAAGVANPGGPTLNTVFHDYDDDGWPDLFVANDWHPGFGFTKNTTYRNDGNGTFTDVSVQLQTDYGIQSMGSDFVDAFNDGGWDFVVSNVEDGHLFHVWNGAQQRYDERAAFYGVQANQLGWAVHFLDYDLDGWSDLYINHSEVFGAPATNTLFRNPGAGGGSWPLVSASAGLALPGRYFTSVVADFDDDGRSDILQLRDGANALLYRNTELGGHWLTISTTGTRSNRSGIGAVVTVLAGGIMQRQMVRSGSGFMSSDDLRLRFGLGGSLVADRVTIRWPSGQVQYLTNVAADQVLAVTEPSLALSGPAALGTTPNLVLTVPGDESRPGAMAFSLSSTPGLPVGDGRIIPINFDPIALLCLTPGNPVLPLSIGILDAQGVLQSPLVIPAYPPLAGVTLIASAATGDPSFFGGIRTIIAPPISVTFF